jgi:hypothetical protein
MSVSITDEIIDAIIQNEGRHRCQAAKARPEVPGSRRMADLKPAWSQLPPGAMPDGAVAGPSPDACGCPSPHRRG